MWIHLGNQLSVSRRAPLYRSSAPRAPLPSSSPLSAPPPPPPRPANWPTPLEKSPANYTDLPANSRTCPPSLLPPSRDDPPSDGGDRRPPSVRPSGVLIPAEVVILKIDTNRAGVTERRTAVAASGHRLKETDEFKRAEKQ